MKPLPGLLLGVLVPITTLAQDVPKRAAAEGTKSYARPSSAYPVLQVVDGATVLLRIDGSIRRVRMIGVEPPSGSRTGGREAPAERAATRFTKDLLLGRTVRLETEAGMASVPRSAPLPAYLYRASDGLLVNREVIAQGHGRAETDLFRHRDLFRAAERAAREAKLGLWAPSPASPPDPSRPPAPATFYLGLPDAKSYHRAGCRLLGSTSEASAVGAAELGQRTPCPICRPDDPATGRTAAAPRGRPRKGRTYNPKKEAEEALRLNQVLGQMANQAVQAQAQQNAAIERSMSAQTVAGPNQANVVVFVSPGGKYYHRAGCRQIGIISSAVTKGEAVGLYSPCPSCNP